MSDKIKAELTQCYDDMDDYAQRYLMLQARMLAQTRPAPKKKRPLLRIVSDVFNPYGGSGIKETTG